MRVKAWRAITAALVGSLLVVGFAAAAFHPDFTAAPSQVSWMRDQGGRLSDWSKGDDIVFWPAEATADSRGYHPVGTTDCRFCHTSNDTSLPPVFPADTGKSTCGRACHTYDVANLNAIVNWSAWPLRVQNVTTQPCGTACHGWLKPIEQEGFESLLASVDQAEPAGYSGPTNPLYLLNYTKDLDGDGRSHKGIYERWGCTGFCHNPQITLEAAEAWGGAGVEPSDLPMSREHGAISSCTECHRFVSPIGGAADLHTTHMPFIQGENLLGNPNGDAALSCTYCHGSFVGDGPQAGGCYNCHLSGHRPETYYWAAIPEGE